MNVCIVIPVYNESRFIGPLLDALKGNGHDIIVVDDGSTDNTGLIAKEAGAIVIQHEGRGGKGASLRDGFDLAVNRKYDGVLAMDGDGQHDPNDASRFIAAAKRNPNSIVTGNRMKDPGKMPFIRYCTNRLMSRLISFVCRQSIPDTQCGYRYISRSVLEQIHLTSRDFEIETEILMKASRKGFAILSIPVRTIYSSEKSKISPFLDTVKFFVFFIKEICSSKA